MYKVCSKNYDENLVLIEYKFRCSCIFCIFSVLDLWCLVIWYEVVIIFLIKLFVICSSNFDKENSIRF